MAIDLDKLRAPPPPQGFRLERAKGRERLEEYVNILIKAYPASPWILEPFTRMILHADLGDYFRHYIGHLNGKPVATSSVLLASGVAGLSNVATMAQARGTGGSGLISSVC